MNDQALEDLGKTTWRDDQWLGFYPLNPFTALDYFSLSPFYDRSCNNEVAKAKNVPIATLPGGIEYELKDAQEPHLFIICKQLRTSPSSVSSLRYYYILDGNVYQAPSMHVALASRLSKSLYNVRTAFKLMQSDLDPLLQGTLHSTQPAAPPQKETEAHELITRDQMRTADRIIVNVLQKYPMQVQPVGPSDGQYHMQADEQQSELPSTKTEGTA